MENPIEETPNALPVLSTEQVIESAKDALKSHALSEKLDEAVAELAAIAVKPIDIGDQVAINLADTARKKAKAIRNSIERKRKELKDVATKYGKAVDGTAEELTRPIEAQERRLENALADVKNRERLEKERKEREELDKYNNRTAILFGMGASFNGLAYELGNLKASPDRVKELNDEQWDGAVAKFKAEADRLAEEARKREEEAEKARKLEEENARLRAELAAMQTSKESPQPPTVLEVDKDGTVVDAVAYPTAHVDGQEVKVTATRTSIALQNRRPIEEPIEVVLETPELSPSEAHIERLLSGKSGDGVAHFRAGFRAGVKFAKEAVLAIMADTATYDTRGKVKDGINGL